MIGDGLLCAMRFFFYKRVEVIIVALTHKYFHFFSSKLTVCLFLSSIWSRGIGSTCVHDEKSLQRALTWSWSGSDGERSWSLTWIRETKPSVSKFVSTNAFRLAVSVHELFMLYTGASCTWRTDWQCLFRVARGLHSSTSQNKSVCFI